VTAVTAQQISLRAAAVMRGLFVQRFGERVSHDGVEWWRFPRKEDVRDGDLTGLKLSGMKMRTIGALAETDLGGLTELEDNEVTPRIPQLPGVGRWSAEWLLARSLARPHVVAAGALGVRKAVAAWFAREPIWTEPRVREAMATFG